MFFVVCNGVGSIFIAVFQCTPIRYSWDKSIEGHCLDRQKNYAMVPVMSFFLDFIIMVMPVWPIWQTHLSAGRKYKLIAMFLIGGL